MNRYRIKTSDVESAMLEILDEDASGYQVRITRTRFGYEYVEEARMTRDLFEVCLRTGYLTVIPEHRVAVA